MTFLGQGLVTMGNVVFTDANLSKFTLTSTGKMYMRQNSGNAQKMFQLLNQELRESLKAEYTADDIKTKIDKMKLDTWSGTYVSFVQQWEYLLHTYDELTVNKGENTGIFPLTDGQKKAMLKKALESSAIMKKLNSDETIKGVKL